MREPSRAQPREIDYALFNVSRLRDQLAASIAVDKSIARALAKAGGALVFAGAMVIIELAALVVVVDRSWPPEGWRQRTTSPSVSRST